MSFKDLLPDHISHFNWFLSVFSSVSVYYLSLTYYLSMELTCSAGAACSAAVLLWKAMGVVVSGCIAFSYWFGFVHITHHLLNDNS